MSYKIKFRIAGNLTKNLDHLFLCSHHRVKSFSTTIFHRNDINNDISIDLETFKMYFEYNRFTGIYRLKKEFKDKNILVKDIFQVFTTK
jgi:hypothetical protein